MTRPLACHMWPDCHCMAGPCPNRTGAAVVGRAISRRSAIRVERTAKIVGTPVYALLVRAWADLMEAGSCELDGQMVSWEEPAVVAVQDGIPIGAITYGLKEWSKSLDVYLAYVRPEHRGSAAFRMMAAELRRLALESDRTRITATVHLQNSRAMRLFQTVGMRASYQTLELYLPPRQPSAAAAP